MRKKSDIIVDQVLHRFDIFDLQGIIWHIGTDFNSGHYTSNVKVNGVWYIADDSKIKQDERFRSDVFHGKVPYILVYKKRTTDDSLAWNIPCSSISSNDMSNAFSSDRIDFIVHEGNLTTPAKRSSETLVENLDTSLAKKQISETNLPRFLKH